MALDVAVLGFERTDIEGRGHFVGSLDVDSGRGCAGGTLTEVLGDSRLCSPLVVAENAEVAFHVLHDKHVVGVVDVGSGGCGLRAYSGVDGDELVKLRLRGQLALRLGSKLRLIGENVDILPLGISGKSVLAGEDSRSGATEFIARELRKAQDEGLGEEVYAALDTGQLGGTLAPPERFLN